MTIKTNLTESDYRAFQRHVRFRYRKFHWIIAVPLLFIVLTSWFGGKPDQSVTQRISVLIGSLLMVSIVWAVLMGVFWLIKKLPLTRFSPQLGAHTFEVSAEGVVEENEVTRVETKVTGIKRVDECPAHYFVITQSGLGHIIPKRDVVNPEILNSLKAAVEVVSGRR